MGGRGLQHHTYIALCFVHIYNVFVLKQGAVASLDLSSNKAGFTHQVAELS